MKVLFFLFITIVYSDYLSISTYLVDSNKNPIKYANIQCDNIGTSTDRSGYFTIYCPEKSVLTISHIKYKTKKINISDVNKTIVLIDKEIQIKPIKIYGHYNKISKKIISTQIINKVKSTDVLINDISSKISNFNYATGTSTPRFFQIRGIGELSQFSGEGPPNYYVNVNVDNIDFSGLSLPLTLFDIEQIEIFKGPNSTLFGQNATGGSINITSNEPTKNKSFKGTFNLENYNGFSSNLSFSNSLTKNLSHNTTFTKNYSDGWIKNKQSINGVFFYKYDTNAINHQAFKHKLLFNNNNMKIKSTIIYSNADNKYDVWSPDNNGEVTYTDYRGLDIQKTKAISLYIEKSNSKVDIIAISSYNHNDIIYSYDSDWGNNEFWNNNPYFFDSYYYGYYNPYNYTDYTDRKRISSSNELRFIFKESNKINLTSGFVKNNIKEYDIRNGWLFGGSALNIASKFDIQNLAFYSELIIIKNNLEFVLGLRNDNNKTTNNITWIDWYDNSNFLNYDISSKNLTAGSIKVNYIYSKNINFTSFISTGYKPKGINQSPNTPDEHKLYNLELTYNCDLGLSYKTDFLELNMSMFYIYRKNPQLRVFYQYDISNPNSFDYAIFNTEYGQNSGLEIEIKSNITEQLAFDATIGYLKTFISDFTYNNGNYGDREQAHAPNYTYNLNINYKLFNQIRYTVKFSGMDEFYFDDQNNHKSKKRNIVDLSIGYTRKIFLYTIWCKNIFDSRYETRGYTFGLEPPDYNIKDYKVYGSPKTFGITLSYTI